jgi:hypothetical protein
MRVRIRLQTRLLELPGEADALDRELRLEEPGEDPQDVRRHRGVDHHRAALDLPVEPPVVEPEEA